MYCIIQPCDSLAALEDKKDGEATTWPHGTFLPRTLIYAQLSPTNVASQGAIRPHLSLSHTARSQRQSHRTLRYYQLRQSIPIARKASLNPPTVKFMSPSRESTQTEGTTQTARERIRTSNIRAVIENAVHLTEASSRNRG